MKHMGHTMASGADKTQKRTGKSGASPTAAQPARKPSGKTAKPAKPARPADAGTSEPKRPAADAVPAVEGPALRKRELIDTVAERSGVRKKHAKAAIEAMLDMLAAALTEGREINLQPFGRISAKRVRETTGARVVTAQIRQSKAGAAPSAPVPAEAAPARAGKSTQTVADAAE